MVGLTRSASGAGREVEGLWPWGERHRLGGGVTAGPGPCASEELLQCKHGIQNLDKKCAITAVASLTIMHTPGCRGSIMLCLEDYKHVEIYAAEGLAF